MRILFSLGHPAHFHLYKNIIKSLESKGHNIILLIKKKDILEDLLKEAGFQYFNILPKGRRDHKIGIAFGLFKRDIRLMKFCLKNKPDLMAGTSIEISHIGKILSIPSLNVNEDDLDIVPLYGKLAYPWASQIISPEPCENGKWEYKTIKYSGYHELAYLNPNHFTADPSIVKRYFSPDHSYFLFRLAKLTAHHDTGIKGLNYKIASNLIPLLESHGKVFITSERELEPEFESYRIQINPLDIHHVMAFARLYIGDSQTMAAEAGVLGTPFIRFNDFVGRISYLSELENKYQLGFGFKTNEAEKMYKKVEELLTTPNLKEIFQERRKKMLNEKIDVAKFLTWFIENYPGSARIMRENPDYQYRFR